MKTILIFFAAAIFAVSAIPSADARTAVSVDFFHGNLAPYGSWREVGDYGYCWRPNNVGNDWSPYSDGRWVYTDAGWTWDSDEPYGWAVYHYGRWTNAGSVGWVWVPGTEWGPGWVSWRHSPDYVGWAPLPPEARFRVSIGLSAWVDDYYNIGPGNYRFVEGRNFGNRRLNTVFIDRRKNISIINQTTNITNITYVNRVAHNGGMDYDRQSKISSTPINRYKLDRREDFDGDPRNQKAEQLRSEVKGDRLRVLAPSFENGTSTAPEKVSSKVEKAEVNHGWKDAGSPSEIAEIKTKMKSKVAAPRELPDQPKFERDEKVKTDVERKPDKEGKTSGEKPTRDDKKADPSIPKNKPEADRPRRQPSDDAKEEPKRKPATPKDNPKRTDKPRNPEPSQPRADDKPKAERKHTPKNEDPRPTKEKDKKAPDETPKKNH